MPRKVRLKEIAKEVGCSIATVSHAFNEPKLVNRKTREEILRVSGNLGYFRKRYFKQRKKVIGVLVSDYKKIIFGPYFMWITESILSRAKEAGVSVIIESFGPEETVLPPMFSKKLLDGVIVFHGMREEQVAMLKETELPIIVCGYPLPNVEVNTVIDDGRAGMYAIAKHLLELGHRQFGYITGAPLLNQATSDRLDGFRYGLREAKLDLPVENIVVGDWGDWEMAAGAVDSLLKLEKVPTTIVCESDPLAFVVCKRLKELGYKVPRDISVTGFDNTPFVPGIDWEKPKLTTIEVDLEKFGRIAANALFNLIEEDSSHNIACRHTLPVKLVIGETTAKIGK